MGDIPSRVRLGRWCRVERALQIFVDGIGAAARPGRLATLVLLLSTLAFAPIRAGAFTKTVDLATVDETGPLLLRGYGYTGDGGTGIPVAGAFDVDADGDRDYAMSAMVASPLGRGSAGEVYLLLGDGTLGAPVDLALPSASVVRILGDLAQENAGSEIWMDDVTGDGLGDLLIARQNFGPPGRTGSGALTILVGGSAVGDFAATLADLDLRSPPPSLTIVTFVGAAALDRLGIWMRTGDVTGDGIADIVVGADQVAVATVAHAGAVYVIRGGSHLATSQVIDLALFGTTALAGNIARIDGAPGFEFHFGATCQIADLDGNGRAEVLAAATLNRAGAILPPAGVPSAHATGGTTDGTLYIAWDDNFPQVWPAGYAFRIDQAPGTTTDIHGATCNRNFGEEILGGLDYDDDGDPDLFVGDITGNCGPVALNAAGSGHVFYDAAALAGLSFTLNAPPALPITDFYGAAAGNIAADTAMHGDFDGDGIGDLAFSSPKASPLGRTNAGSLHVFFGNDGQWPASIDLANVPGSVLSTEVHGALGRMGGNRGDTLAYSGAAGDVDGDGRTDLLTNEMLGDGVGVGAIDAGNLVLLSGALLQVPEPSAAAQGTAALLMLGLLRRRARRPTRNASLVGRSKIPSRAARLAAIRLRRIFRRVA